MTKLKNKNWRFPKIVFIVFIVIFLLLYLQFTYLSLFPSLYGINMDKFASLRSTYSSVLLATRGTIFDKDENPLALNVSSYTVIAYLDPNRSTNSSTLLHVDNIEATAKALAPVLSMDESYILELLNRYTTKGVKQVELGPGGREITELKKEEIEELNLPGIDFVESQKRYYPNGDFASYILGYAKVTDVDTDSDGTNDGVEITGELGIESKYNDLLKGTNGHISYQKDRFGYKIPDTKEEKVEEVNGDDIYLTIDSNIQRFTESAIKEYAAIYNPEWLFITVMDAKTGAILASSSSPSFNPNTRDITNYENPLTSYLYEPGSTMKTYTYMCALEKKTYDGNATFLSGSFTVDKDGNKVNDWNPSGWGYLTFDQGYVYSSNVGVANIVSRFINKSDLKDCLSKYGFGKQTGIELSRELTGSIEFNYPLEVAAAGFGQGITSTPIQQLQSLTMIANNGVMLKPHIISKIVNPNTGEIVYETAREELGQIVSSETANKIKSLMYDTVNASWAPTNAILFRVDGLNIIGKSGTAQIFNNKTGSYEAGSYIYSFSGMFPYDDPKIIIYAAVKKPSWGDAAVVSKATKEVIENTAKYLQISTNNIVVKEEITLSSYLNKDITSLDSIKDKVNVVIIGTGNKIIKQYPGSGEKVLAGDKVFIVTNDSEIKMPNTVGYSRREATTLLDLIGISYNIEGFGYVTNQTIKEGTVVDDTVTLTLLNKAYIEEN